MSNSFARCTYTIDRKYSILIKQIKNKKKMDLNWRIGFEFTLLFYNNNNNNRTTILSKSLNVPNKLKLKKLLSFIENVNSVTNIMFYLHLFMYCI